MDAFSGWIAVNRVHRESRQADRDVLCAAFVRSGVADPFTGVGDDRLPGGNLERSVLVFDAESALENHAELVERRSLARLQPSGGAMHVGDAGGSGLRVDAPDVFVDELGFVAGGWDAGRLRDQGWHGALGQRLAIRFLDQRS